MVRSVLLFAEHRDADLIVAGATSRGPVASRLLGNTPIEMIRRARRPVLVVTPPGGSELRTGARRWPPPRTRTGIFATKPIDRLVEDTHEKETSCAAPSARST